MSLLGDESDKDYASVEAAAGRINHAKSSAERGFGAGLCTRCRWAHIFRREAKMGVTAMCVKIGAKEVPTDIVECSAFEEPAAMSLYDMQQIALPIDARVGIQDGSYR